MTNSLEDEVKHVLAGMDDKQDDQEQEQPGATGQDTQPEETIHIHYFPDAIVIVKEDGAKSHPDTTVETTLAQTKKSPVFIAYAICSCYLLLIISCIAFQAYEILNPPIATVTIIPKSQMVTLTGTLQLGRVLQPLTISQSQTTTTTGKGHQSAKQARGAITFYNGQFQRVFIAAGTILTGASGVQFITDQDAAIPAANPPSFGQVTISAHAINPGVRGNIPAYDINQACCETSVLAKNTQAFYGGQDERNFQTVAKSDIVNTAIPLKTAVMQSMSAALLIQLTPQEQLSLLPCSPTVTSDHQPGQEATQVKVSVSETCIEVAFNTQALAEKATALLSSQAQHKAGAGYSLFGTVQVWVKQASVTNTAHPLVFLSFKAQGTWIYGISHTAQEQITQLIASKTTQEALQMLLSLPGVEQASIRFDGFGDDTRLPKGTGYIHLTIFVV